MNKKLKILKKSEFDKLFFINWVAAIQYLIKLEKSKIWQYFFIKNFEDFIIYKNYIDDVEKIFNLINAYKFLIKMKISIKEIKLIDIEMLNRCQSILNKENYNKWLIAMQNPIEFELLLEQYQGDIDISLSSFRIGLLNSIIINFNDLIINIEGIDYWDKIPDVNKKVFLDLFKENLKKIIDTYSNLKYKFEDDK